MENVTEKENRRWETDDLSDASPRLKKAAKKEEEDEEAWVGLAMAHALVHGLRGKRVALVDKCATTKPLTDGVVEAMRAAPVSCCVIVADPTLHEEWRASLARAACLSSTTLVSSAAADDLPRLLLSHRQRDAVISRVVHDWRQQPRSHDCQHLLGAAEGWFLCPSPPGTNIMLKMARIPFDIDRILRCDPHPPPPMRMLEDWELRRCVQQPVYEHEPGMRHPFSLRPSSKFWSKIIKRCASLQALLRLGHELGRLHDQEE